MRTAEDICREHGIRPPSYQFGRHYTTCPKCSHQRKRIHQKNKCLGITIDDKGVHFGCSHCEWTGGGYYMTNGKDRNPIIAIYDYVDEAGVLLFQVCRKADKTFPQRRKPRPGDDPAKVNGGWFWGTGGTRKVLYRLLEVIKAIGDGRVIVIVEGEKDADNLWAIGIAATCNPGGASKPGQAPKWRKEYSEMLRGVDIIVMPDHDPSGYAHSEAVVRMSAGIAKRVRVLKLADHWPECKENDDVSDWLDAGGTREQLDLLFEKATEWSPSGNDTSAAAAWDDPDWSILDDRRGKLPLFPIDALPTKCGEWVKMSAQGAGVPVDYVAVPFLGVVSSEIGTARRIQASTSWTEPMTLWTGIVGFSGTGKTPGISVTKRVLAENRAERQKEDR